MKASILNRIGEPLIIKEVEIPLPKDGEVLIEVHVAGMNFAESQKQQGRYFIMPSLPAILGLEVAGIVVKAGANVPTEWLGKRVVALLSGVGEQGGYAEFAVSRADELLHLPENVTFEESLAIPIQGLSAYFMLNRQAQIRDNNPCCCRWCRNYCYPVSKGYGSQKGNCRRKHSRKIGTRQITWCRCTDQLFRRRLDLKDSSIHIR
jgi:NADPH:quinone reductase-like Zn-dependent oxidoreductase